MKKNNKKKNITRNYLQGAAYRYLERYATTEANLISVLKRKVDRILLDSECREEKREEAISWINEIVENCVKNNLVNDQLYTQGRVNSFLIAGNSLATIKNKLRAKGVPAQIIHDVIEGGKSDKPSINLISCIKYAKKRRFGPFRVKEIQEKTTSKEQASMARAGFSYDESMKVLKATREELEDLLYES